MVGHRNWEEIKQARLDAMSTEERTRFEGYQKGCAETWAEMQYYYDELKAAGDRLAERLRWAQTTASWLCDDETMEALKNWEKPHDGEPGRQDHPAGDHED